MTVFTVEGNVGAGKTTLLKQLETATFSRPHVVIYEPVDEWMNFRLEEGDKSLFEMFYEDQKKYAFVFQMMAMQSRYESMQKFMEEHADKIIICERSFLTDCEIFAKLNHREGNISDIELHVYKKWHTFFMKVLKPTIKGIVYLHAEPAVCKERIEKRNRHGEEGFSDLYLEKLHESHEMWLSDQTLAPVERIDASGEIDVAAVVAFIEKELGTAA